MGKRKADGDDQSASKTKMDIDGEESGSDDVKRTTSKETNFAEWLTS